MTKRIFSMLLCVVMVVTSFFGSSLTASAISNNVSYSGTKYYTVTTKACYWYPGSESITVSQSKEIYYSNNAHTRTKSRNALSCTVTCTPISWSGNTRPQTIKKTFGGSSTTIKLDKNVTYSIKITWKTVICAFNHGVKKEGYAYISGMHKAKYA